MRADKVRVLAAAAVVAVAMTAPLAGCGDDGPAVEQTGPSPQASPSVEQATDRVVAASWQLGMAALQASEGTAGGVVSPSSLVTALAMLSEGAQGAEASVFDTALGASGQDRTDAVVALQQALARYGGDPAAVQAEELPVVPVLHTAQQLAVAEGVTPSQTFVDRLQQGYGAGVLTTDLSSEAGIEPLSAWVRENTGGLVEQSAIQPSPNLVVVLQDAVVLAAAWQQPFDPDATDDDDFTLPDGSLIQVPTMHGTFFMPVVSQDGWQAVRLPYTADLSADLMLPPEADDAAKAPASADPATLAALSDRLDTSGETEVELSLPTLDMTARADLMPLLEGLGLPGPLTGLLDGNDPVSVSQAVQQAVLRVDEQGTRAAAVTEFGATRGGLPPTEEILKINFDRPFLLVVRDNTTGWPVFIASVTNPQG